MQVSLNDVRVGLLKLNMRHIDHVVLYPFISVLDKEDLLKRMKIVARRYYRPYFNIDDAEWKDRDTTDYRIQVCEVEEKDTKREATVSLIILEKPQVIDEDGVVDFWS